MRLTKEQLEFRLKMLSDALEPFAKAANEYDAEFGRRETKNLATAIGPIKADSLRNARDTMQKYGIDA